MKRIGLFLIAMLAIVSCADKATPETPVVPTPGTGTDGTETKDLVSIMATIGTKVDATDDGEGGYTFTWRAEDELGGWSKEAATTDFAKFSIAKDGYSAEKSTFEGNYSDNAETFVFVHPYIDAANISAEGKLAIDLSQQVAEANLGNLQDNTYMISNAFDVTAAEPEITLSHLGAAIDVKLATENVGAMKLTKVVLEGAMLPSTVSVDLTKTIEEEYFAVETSGKIEVIIPEMAAVENVFSFTINTFPFEIAADDDITLTASYAGESGSTKSETTTLTFDEALTIARATRNSFGFVVETEPTGPTDPGTDPSVTYNVGDLYPNAESPVGIVFEVSDGGAHGKVVSLKEVMNKSNDDDAQRFNWGETGVLMGTSDADNGMANTKIMFDHYKDDMDNFFKKSSAFHWIYTVMNDSTDGPWYMPAKNELKSLAAYALGLNYANIKDRWTGKVMPDCTNPDCAVAIDAFVAAIKAAGGVDFNKSGKYYSSTENGDNTVWMMLYASGTGNTTLIDTEQTKNSTWIRTRPIMQF